MTVTTLTINADLAPIRKELDSLMEHAKALDELQSLKKAIHDLGAVDCIRVDSYMNLEDALNAIVNVRTHNLNREKVLLSKDLDVARERRKSLAKRVDDLSATNETLVAKLVQVDFEAKDLRSQVEGLHRSTELLVNRNNELAKLAKTLEDQNEVLRDMNNSQRKTIEGYQDKERNSAKPEKRWMRNIVKVARIGDQSVTIVFSSCATASEFLQDYDHALVKSETVKPKQEDEVCVTRNEQGQIVAVTRQDEEGQVTSVIALA